MLRGDEIKDLLMSLSSSKKYINREFMARVGERLLVLYRCGGVDDRDMSGALASLA